MTFWGPAWVVWRWADDRCGWAPLPLHADFDVRLGLRFNGVRVALDFDFGLRPAHFTFVNVADFGARDLNRCCLSPVEVTRVYNHTTIINRYTVVNNTVVNHGVPVERIAAATHKPITKVVIRDLPAGSPALSRLQGSGRAETEVFRPKLAAPAKPISMVAQKVDQRHPVIQHTSVASAAAARQSAPAPGSRATMTQPARTVTQPAVARTSPQTGQSPALKPAVERAPSRPSAAQTAAVPGRSAAPTTSQGRPAPAVVASTSRAPSAANAPSAAASRGALRLSAPSKAATATAPSYTPQLLAKAQTGPTVTSQPSRTARLTTPKAAQQNAELRPSSQRTSPTPSKSESSSSGKAAGKAPASK